MQIKRAISGVGKAEKKQVQYMTKTILGLKSMPKPDDAADALAIALTLAQTNTKLVESEVQVFTNNNLKKTDKNEIINKRNLKK